MHSMIEYDCASIELQQRYCLFRSFLEKGLCRLDNSTELHIKEKKTPGETLYIKRTKYFSSMHFCHMHNIIDTKSIEKV